MYNTLELINELNSLSLYGMSITNSDCNNEDFDKSEDLNDIGNIKTKEWIVTSIFNPRLGDISYTAYNEDLNLALKEAIDWCKENLNNEDKGEK